MSRTPKLDRGGAFGLKNHIFYESRYNVIPNRCRSSLQMESKVVQSGSSASKAACTRYIQFHASGLSTSAVTSHTTAAGFIFPQRTQVSPGLAT